MSKHLLIVLTAIVALCSCGSKRADEGDLNIVFTTDVHGLVMPYNFLTNSEAAVSMAQVYAYVEDLRNKGEECILLDAGDLGEGQPSTYYYNYIAENEKHVLGKAMNYMKYDALGIGENEIQFGESIYKRRMPKWYDMPIVCANAYDMATAQTIFKPYAIIEKGGFKVAVLGLTSPDMSNWLSPTTIGNLIFEDLDRAARHWITTIKSEEKPDMIVGLFHISATESKKLVQEIEGLDLVLCGQDHVGVIDSVKDMALNEVKILQPLPRCQELGHAKIHLKRNAEGGVDKNIVVERIALADIKPSAAFVSEFASEVKRINDYLDQPLGSIEEDLDPVDALIGPSAVMSAIHDMQRWTTSAKISITNFVSTYNKIPAGEFSTRDLFNMYRFENRLWTVKMTGHEIKNLLEYCYGQQYATQDETAKSLIAYVYDEEGKVKFNNFGPMLKTAQYNYISAAGIEYVVDVTKPEGERVEILALSETGAEFNLDETYQVAMPDHLAVGTLTKNALGWENTTVGTHIVSFSSNDIRNNFTNYISNVKTIKPSQSYNWKVIPDALYKEAAPKEKTFLSYNLK